MRFAYCIELIRIFDTKKDDLPPNSRNLIWICPICKKRLIFCFEEGKGGHFRHPNHFQSYNTRKKCYNCPKILFRQIYKFNYAEHRFRNSFLKKIEKEMRLIYNE